MWFLYIVVLFLDVLESFSVDAGRFMKVNIVTLADMANA